jgi:hypothetical protein
MSQPILNTRNPISEPQIDRYLVVNEKDAR